MEEKLREYMEKLFEGATPTRSAVELKEEMLQNLVEKYRDLLAEGKSPEAAYNIATSGVGDVSELLTQLKEEEWRMQPEATEREEKARRRSAMLVSSAVILYILSVTPVIANKNDESIIAMFVMVAIATGLLIFNSMTKPSVKKADDTVAAEFKAWQSENSERRKLLKAIKNALWSVTVAIYLLVSFLTGAWHITWIIFLIATAIENIIKASFELKN